MMAGVRKLLILFVLAALALAQEKVPQPRPIDFNKVERKIQKLPQLLAPRYGLFLFGFNGEKKVWAVVDKSSKHAKTHDLLYLDKNADGDLTQKGERFEGEVSKSHWGTQAVFSIGEFTDPATNAVHTEFKITYTPKSVRYRMLWRGKKVTMGSYGPTGDSYVNFAPSIKTAPILVPGWDRPFQFEHWMSGTLQRGQPSHFMVFVGNRGSRTGAFTCVDDQFLPAGEYVLATLLYRDGRGKRQRYQAKLTSRC